MKCGRKRETGQKRGIRKNDGKDCDRNTGNESTDSHDCRFVCKKKRRVAGYARVSTEKDEQYTSYEAQVDYYTQFIQSHAGWEFVKVYTDATVIIGLKQNPTHGRRFSPIFFA